MLSIHRGARRFKVDGKTRYLAPILDDSDLFWVDKVARIRLPDLDARSDVIKWPIKNLAKMLLIRPSEVAVSDVGYRSNQGIRNSERIPADI